MLITYQKTILGWYNFTEIGVFYHNIKPTIFRKITGISENAVMGCVELTVKQVEELKKHVTFTGICNGWKVV